MADHFSRRLLISIAAILWSITSIGTSFSNKLIFIALNRFLLGVFEAFAPPAVFSMIADYFPPEKRTTANAIISLAIFVGAGLASITTIFIGSFGWRLTYFCIGCFGITVGLIALIFIREPVRGRFDPKKIEVAHNADEPKETLFQKYISGFAALLKNKCTRWILLGGMCRFW